MQENNQVDKKLMFLNQFQHCFPMVYSCRSTSPFHTPALVSSSNTASEMSDSSQTKSLSSLSITDYHHKSMQILGDS